MFQTQGAPFRPLPVEIEPSILDKVETILSGKWSVDDVLEMGVDEMTTAAGVGSGLAKPIGPVGRHRDDHYEKLRRAFEEYLSKSGQKSSSKALGEFIEDSAPGAGEDLTKGLTSYLREKGYDL